MTPAVFAVDVFRLLACDPEKGDMAVKEAQVVVLMAMAFVSHTGECDPSGDEHRQGVLSWEAVYQDSVFKKHLGLARELAERTLGVPSQEQH